MKEIELDDKEIKLLISALDLKNSRDLDKVYNNVPYPFNEKEKIRRNVVAMELLVDKFLRELDKAECDETGKEALVVDWNMEEFKQVLREVVREVVI